MFEAEDHRHLVPFDGSFQLDHVSTGPPKDTPKRKKLKKKLEDEVEDLQDLQRILYAHDSHALLLIFQAMDAAGKDSTIRAVMSGVNPAGCQVHSFKQPSAEELDHDFLWRSACRLPERGRIGIFNRSYYEEVLVVRVHPEFLGAQNLPADCRAGDAAGEAAGNAQADFGETFWRQRYESIRDHEKHLARNGTVILKFFLNVSRDEQKERFLSRLDEPHKHWKFSAGDVRERGLWPKYMAAYEEALRETSRPWAPWYAIPADSKPYMRLTVARIVAQAMRGLGLRYPDVDPKEKARFDEMRTILESEED